MIRNFLINILFSIPVWLIELVYKFNKDVNKYIYQHNENNKQTRINVIYLDEIKSRNKYISFTQHIDVPFVYALFDEMTNKFK